MGKIAASAATLLLTLAACSGGNSVALEEGSPEALIVEFWDQAVKGQWEAQWETLHPAQQELIPRNHFVECRSQDLPDFDVEIGDIVETETFEDVAIPGTTETDTATAVTYEIEISVDLLSEDMTETDRVFEVNDDLRWVLRTPEDYLDGDCPEFL